jgi:hypothetical protein
MLGDYSKYVFDIRVGMHRQTLFTNFIVEILKHVSSGSGA